MPTVISRLTLIQICSVCWIFQCGKIAPWGRNHASCLLFEKIQFDTATPYVHRQRNWGYVAVLQCQIKCNYFMETDGQYKRLYRTGEAESFGTIGTRPNLFWPIFESIFMIFYR